MVDFTIQANDYLEKNIRGFYHTEYVGHQKPGNPDYINRLKNTYNTFPPSILNIAVQELNNVLMEDLPQILRVLQLNSLTVCVVPRAKTSYKPNQLLFKSTIRKVVNQLNHFIDGTDYITRHSNTRTTHLPPNTPNYNNDGEKPYRGITKDTCNISNKVNGKDILLIDDLYTKTVNIDEDAIQALLTCGANSVSFYSIGCRM